MGVDKPKKPAFGALVKTRWRCFQLSQLMKVKNHLSHLNDHQREEKPPVLLRYTIGKQMLAYFFAFRYIIKLYKCKKAILPW